METLVRIKPLPDAPATALALALRPARAPLAKRPAALEALAHKAVQVPRARTFEHDGARDLAAVLPYTPAGELMMSVATVKAILGLTSRDTAFMKVGSRLRPLPESHLIDMNDQSIEYRFNRMDFYC